MNKNIAIIVLFSMLVLAPLPSLAANKKTAKKRRVPDIIKIMKLNTSVRNQTFQLAEA